MGWLFGQTWPWLVLAFLLGAVITILLTLRKLEVTTLRGRTAGTSVDTGLAAAAGAGAVSVGAATLGGSDAEVNADVDTSYDAGYDADPSVDYDASADYDAPTYEADVPPVDAGLEGGDTVIRPADEPATDTYAYAAPTYVADDTYDSDATAIRPAVSEEPVDAETDSGLAAEQSVDADADAGLDAGAGAVGLAGVGGAAFVAGKYAGSAEPNEDGSGPDGYTIKGNEDSMLFHTEESPYYGRTKAEVWFDTEESAEAAGFTRWDRRHRASADESTESTESTESAEESGDTVVPTGATALDTDTTAADGLDTATASDETSYSTDPLGAPVGYADTATDTATDTAAETGSEGSVLDGTETTEFGAVGAAAAGAVVPGPFYGSAQPNADDSQPAGYPIKGNEDSMLFHTEDSPYYKRTGAEVWFDTEDNARMAGFTRWDQRNGVVAEPEPLVSLPAAGAYGEGSADPLEDGASPHETFTIKGNADSMLYHPADSPYYSRTGAEVWFSSEDAARGAGFTRWNERNTVTEEPATLVSVPEGQFGPGSADPLDDGSAPAGFSIKGNADSMLYHTDQSPYYGRTKAEVWFNTEAAARAAGFVRWDEN